MVKMKLWNGLFFRLAKEYCDPGKKEAQYSDS